MNRLKSKDLFSLTFVLKMSSAAIVIGTLWTNSLTFVILSVLARIYDTVDNIGLYKVTPTAPC